MQQLLKQFVIQHSGTSLVLLPSKLVWWPDQNTLLMADSHFGKASTFRKAGLAVPSGTTSKMLAILTQYVMTLKAQTIVVLGDLLHSNVPAQNDFELELTEWRRHNSALRLVLVKGNHDRRAHSFYAQLGIEVHEALSLRIGPFLLSHAPEDATGSEFSLCGHIHPSIRFEKVKLPCFWLRANQLVLPAFGEFTGTANIPLAVNETAIAICEESLAVVSHGLTKSQLVPDQPANAKHRTT